jgi:hypothetical protein
VIKSNTHTERDSPEIEANLRRGEKTVLWRGSLFCQAGQK